MWITHNHVTCPHACKQADPHRQTRAVCNLLQGRACSDPMNGSVSLTLTFVFHCFHYYNHTSAVLICSGQVTHQAPLSMRFFRQEYWGGLPFPPPGDLCAPGMEPASPESPAQQADSFTAEPLEKPPDKIPWNKKPCGTLPLWLTHPLPEVGHSRRYLQDNGLYVLNSSPSLSYKRTWRLESR